jgi:ParB-like chromosome segregation protein Spo0J
MRRTKELELDLGEVSNARQDDGRASDPSRTRDHASKNAGLPGQEADRCRSIRLSKILDPEPDRQLDWALVFSIAESARTIGFLHPIAVRKVQIKRKSKFRTKTVLVAGAHRLAAAHYLVHERIDCRYVDNDDATSVQLVQIGEDLFRKQLTVLQQAELVTKWYELVSKNYVYGQVDRKNKRGRPPSGISRVARDLPLGTSVEARRKIIQRAGKIARLQPEAKQAAIDAGLDNDQRALLVIAAESGRKAQLRKIAKLMKPAEDQRATDAAARESAGREEPGEPERRRKPAKLAKSSNDQPDKGNAGEPSADSEEADEPGSQLKRNRAKPNHPETTFEQLEERWQKDLRNRWMYAPNALRERFIAMLRRARSKAHTDYLQFVRDVFQGREKVYAKELYALAKRRGLSKKSVRMVLNGLCYPRKRSGYGSSGRYYYRNRNVDWKEELVKISRVELVAREQGPNDVGADTDATSRSEEPKEASRSQSVKKNEFWSDDDLLL